MWEILAVASGGALGAVTRHGLNTLAAGWFGSHFPYGILIINVLGSLLMGVLFVLLLERSMLPTIWRSILMVGALGAFTTFSTFSLQAFELIESGRLLAGSIYILSSVFLCLIAVLIGIYLTRELTS